MNSEREITAEEIVEKLTQEAPQGGEVSYDGFTVKGKLDLRHRVIQVAVTLTNCTFTDEVDLRCCEFKQAVDFAGSRFQKDLDSGQVICRKSLAFTEAVFQGDANFNGLQCEGTGFFEDAQFENEEKDINFGHARFVQLECEGATFKGGADFNAVQCERSGFFKDAKFENKEKNINFVHARFGQLVCQKATFRGGASFNTLQCEGSGFFKDVKFENKEKDINFAHARFGQLECEGATFKGGASFNGLQCKGATLFTDAKFENKEKNINFGHARFGQLACQKATFKGGATFNSIQCERGGLFMDAQFENAERGIDFSYTRFETSLEFQRTTFAGKVDFKDAEVTGTAILWKTTFRNSVILNCATINNLSMRNPKSGYGADSLPFGGKDVDLRRCKFSIFEGTKEQQKHLVEAQSPEKFSMDPYLQFEKYYKSIGDEDYAKKVYYTGRRSVRENAVDWSWSRKVKDWLLCWTVGYGVKIQMLLIWIIPLLIIGTAIFWSDKALVAKQNSAAKSKESIAQKTSATGETQQPGHVAVISGHAKHLFHRFGYSLDLLTPIVNLRIAERYQLPQGWWGIRSVYAVIHIVMGWILIPLLIASLSGVIKK